MKSIIFSILFIFSFQSVFGQDLNKFIRCEIYVYRWKAKPQYPVTESSIKNQYDLKIDNRDFESVCFCRDYLSLEKRLTSGFFFTERNNNTHPFNDNINALAEFHFNQADSSSDLIIRVAFDSEGNYFFNNIWYRIDAVMFFSLFRSLSDEMIRSSVIESAKRKIIRRAMCWYLTDDE